jgi:predicted nucleotide-binding protein
VPADHVEHGLPADRVYRLAWRAERRRGRIRGLAGRAWVSDPADLDSDLEARLEQAAADLKLFQDGWSDYGSLDQAGKAEFSQATDRLIERTVWLSKTVEALTGQRYVSMAGRTFDPWSTGLDPNPMDGTTQSRAIRLQFVAQLRNMVRRALGAARDGVTVTASVERVAQPSPRKVFLVHGPADRRHEVLRLLENGDLEAISLQEQVGQGRTIIEQLEHYSDVGYAVVLATGDDVGRRAADPPTKDQPRARQNVILELGWFMGRLRRDRVILLYEPGVELPSDYTAVIYISLAEGDWQRRLARELKVAGMDVNIAKMLAL